MRNASFYRSAAIASCLTLSACGNDSTPGRTTSRNFEPTVDCSTVSAEPADIATVDTSATPRADFDAEMLALETSAEFIAPEELFQRVSAELTGIRARFPEVAGIGVLPCQAPNSLILHFTEKGFEQVKAGTYDAWDAFNANLRLTDLDLFENIRGAALHFEGRYNVPRLVQEYGKLPEVTVAEPDGFAGDGPDICLARRGEFHFYIFRAASGDCPSGCIEENFLAFEVDASGNIVKVGEWDGSGDPPQWFSGAGDCRAFL